MQQSAGVRRDSSSAAAGGSAASGGSMSSAAPRASSGASTANTARSDRVSGNGAFGLCLPRWKCPAQAMQVWF